MFRHNHLLVCHLAARVIPLLGTGRRLEGPGLAHETEVTQSHEKIQFSGENPARLPRYPAGLRG